MVTQPCVGPRRSQRSLRVRSLGDRDRGTRPVRANAQRQLRGDRAGCPSGWRRDRLDQRRRARLCVDGRCPRQPGPRRKRGGAQRSGEARLAHCAEPGEVLVSAATQAEVGSRFPLESIDSSPESDRIYSRGDRHRGAPDPGRRSGPSRSTSHRRSTRSPRTTTLADRKPTRVRHFMVLERKRQDRRADGAHSLVSGVGVAPLACRSAAPRH